MKMYLFFLLLILGITGRGLHALEINYKTIEVLGTGNTRSEAIQWAQINAIQMVTGTTISASTWAQEKLSSSDGRARTQQSSQIDVAKETAGVIRSSEIKSTLYNKQLEEWNAILLVTVLDIDRATGRKSISISDLRADNPSYKTLAKDLTLNVKSKLTASRKFLVIEQNLGKKFTKELDAILENPLLPLTEKVIVKNGLPPELVLIGKVERASLQIKELTPSSELITLKIPDVSISVNYQIIDIFTSATKFHDVATFNLNHGDFSGSRQAVSNSNISLLSAEIVGAMIVEKILDTIYPAVITSISNENRVSLNFGAEFYKTGDQFDIYRRGDRIYDPYTREFISWDERFLGKVKVTRSLPKVSFGEIEASEEDLTLIRNELTDKSRQFVAYKTSSGKQNNGAQIKKIREKFDNENEIIEEEF